MSVQTWQHPGSITGLVKGFIDSSGLPVVREPIDDILQNADSYPNTVASLFYDDVIAVIASREGIASEVSGVHEVTVEAVDGKLKSRAVTGPGRLPEGIIEEVERLAGEIAGWLREKYGDRAGSVVKDALHAFIRKWHYEDEELEGLIRVLAEYKYLRASLVLALEKIDRRAYEETLYMLALYGIPSGSPARFTMYGRYDFMYIREDERKRANATSGYREGIYR